MAHRTGWTISAARKVHPDPKNEQMKGLFLSIWKRKEPNIDETAKPGWNGSPHRLDDFCGASMLSLDNKGIFE